ncbi:YibE/F family protein [Corynebacterium tapiri]|uniref:YibE/F family protein n=1 Tax=Corynebacterium tapiri TaxID=1448266 RepID=A0A5C4U1F5_9CORY|nr:YibE/F family protein [Corynebacterium tapiri]TNL95071.1 YibE/F family protein [Corynebacterium tapiri]
MGRHSSRGSTAYNNSPNTHIYRRILLGFLVVAGIATLLGLVLTWPSDDPVKTSPEFENTYASSQSKTTATVTAIEPGECGPQCYDAKIEITDGSHKGATSTLHHYGVKGEAELEQGDKIRVVEGPPAPPTSGMTGQVGEPTWVFADFQRTVPLSVWSAVIVVFVLALGALRGLRSLIGLVLSMAVVAIYLLPGLLRGGDPMTLAVLTGSFILFAVVFLVHGWNWKAASALGGTLVALGITTWLAKVAINTVQLQGLGNEDNLKLALYLPDISLEGLMLCGFVIGALGALNDVTIAQASAVNELALLEPTASRLRLFLAAMKVGQDHVASMVYTLVLTYVGAALPLLLLLSAAGRPLGETLTSDIMATELVRSGIGALGLILAVPLATLFAAWTVSRSEG